MRRISWLLIFNFFCFFHLSIQADGQSYVDPPVIEITGVDLNWIHLTENPNFINGEFAPVETSFSSSIPRWIVKRNNALLIFEQSLINIDMGGFELTSLDLDAGEIEWRIDHNYYNGLEYFQAFNEQSIFELSDDNLTLYGYQSLDSISIEKLDGFPNLYFYSTPIQLNVDLNNGIIDSIRVGKNTNENTELDHNVVSHFEGKLIKDLNNNLIHLDFTGNLYDNQITNVVYLYSVDEALTIDSSKVDSIVYSTGIKSNLSQLISGQYFMQLSNKNYVVFNNTKAVPDISESPAEAIFSIFKINAFDDVDLLNKVDLTSNFPKQESPFTNFAADTFLNSFVIHQTVFDVPAGGTEYEGNSWLSWYTNEGELINEFHDFGNQNLNYRFISSIGIVDSNLIFAIGVHSEDEIGFDLFKFGKLNSTPELIGSIRVSSSESLELINIRSPLKVGQNNFIFPMRARYFPIEDFDFDTQVTYYLNVDLKQILTSNEIIGKARNEINLFPNPTSSRVTITGLENIKGQVQLLNSFGSMLITRRIIGEQDCIFNLEELVSGIYIIKVLDHNGTPIKNLIFHKIER